MKKKSISFAHAPINIIHKLKFFFFKKTKCKLNNPSYNR